jgi:hypothetical protein
VPTSDAIEGSIGEGVEDILSTRKGKRIQVKGYYIWLMIGNSVPVIVAFTQSDWAFPRIWCENRNARSKACGQLCRPLFRGEPRDVPAVLVSGDYSLLVGVAL